MTPAAPQLLRKRAREARALQRPEAAHAWELRGAWAKGKDVRLTLDDICIIRTVVGRVTTVAATDAYAEVAGWHVPIARIQAIGKPTVRDREEYATQRADALRVLEQADRLTVYSPGQPTQ